MRKIILGLAVSLDGYIARQDGSVDWLKLQDLTEGAQEMQDFFSSIDAIFWGRKTFEKGIEMMGDEENSDGIMNYVFSRSARESRRRDVKFVSQNVKEFVEDLTHQEGKNISLMGGGDLARTFFQENLIDEIILGIQPVILGRGIPLFLPHDRQTELERIDVKLRQSGTVQIIYRVKKTTKNFPAQSKPFRRRPVRR